MATFTGQLISATYDAIIKTVDNDPIGATAKLLTDGLGNNTPLYVSTTQIGIGITPTEALHVSGNALITGSITIDTNATISGNLSWGSLTDTGESITITKFVDAADGIANNNNDTSIPTSAAVKSLVDSSITAQDLDFSGDNGGTGSVDLDSQIFAINGTTNQITTVQSGQSLTIALPFNITIGGIVNATTFSGDLNGTINTLTTAVTQAAGDNSTKVATTAFVSTALEGQDTLAEVLAIGNTTGGTDIAVSAGDDITLVNNSKAIFGANDNLQTYSDGTDGYVDNTGGELKIRTNELRLLSYGTSKYITADSGADVSLYYNNVKKFETTSYGINVTGAIKADDYISIEGSTNPYLRIQDTTNEEYLNLYSSDNESAIVYTQDTFKISSGVDFLNQTPRLTIDSSGNSTFSGSITTGTGLQLYTDGSGNGVIYNLGQDKDLYFVVDDGGTGVNALVFDSSNGGAATFAGSVTVKSGNKLILNRPNNGVASEISTDASGTMILNSVNDEGFKFQNAGTTFLTLDTSDNATFAGNVFLPDNKYATFGGANNAWELQIGVVGDNAFIEKTATTNGDLYIKNNGSGKGIIFQNGGATALTIDSSQNATFAGTVLIDGVSNYTGLTVKGSGGSRPAITLSNVNQGDLAILYGTENNALVIATGASGLTALTIDSSQNSTFAGNNVDVKGSSAGNTQIRITDSTGTTGTNSFDLINDGSAAYVWNRKQTDLNFATYGTLRMKIRASGTVGIGANGGFDSQMLSIDAGVLDGAIYATSTDANCFASFRDVNSTANIEYGAIGNAHVFRKDANESMRIDSSGTLTVGAQTSTRLVTTLTENDKVDINAVDGTSTARNLTFSTGNTERMRIASGGEIQAQTSGGYYLTENTTNAFSITSNGANGYLAITDEYNSAERMRITSGGAILQQGPTGGGTNTFYTWQYGNDSNYKLDLKQNVDSGIVKHIFGVVNAGSSYDNNLVLDRGNVGIGVANPNAYYGKQLVVAAADESGITIMGTASNQKQYLCWASNSTGANAYAGFIAYDHNTNSMSLATNGGAGAITIDNAQNVGIGPTSPQSKLHIGESATVGSNFTTAVNNSQLFVHNVGANTNSNVIFAGGQSGASGGTGAYSFGQNGQGYTHWIFYHKPISTNQSSVGSISSTSTATAYNTSSDYRLKENVVEMTGSLDRVSQLKPSRFNFIEDEDKTIDGFLAHEVQDIVPEAITGEKDAVDEDGNAIYQGIDQSKLVPLLVGAIQELKAEIELLKTQINN